VVRILSIHHTIYFVHDIGTLDQHSYVVVNPTFIDVKAEYENFDPAYDTIVEHNDLSGQTPDGYWKTSTGETYFLTDIYFTDRVTGEIYYETHPVFLNDTTTKQLGRPAWDYNNAVNNGVQDFETKDGISYAGDAALDTPVRFEPSADESDGNKEAPTFNSVFFTGRQALIDPILLEVEHKGGNSFTEYFDAGGGFQVERTWNDDANDPMWITNLYFLEQRIEKFLEYEDGSTRSINFSEGIISSVRQTRPSEGSEQDWTEHYTEYLDDQLIIKEIFFADSTIQTHSYSEGYRIETTKTGNPAIHDWSLQQIFYDEHGGIQRKNITFVDGTHRTEWFENGSKTRTSISDSSSDENAWSTILITEDSSDTSRIKEVSLDNGVVRTEYSTLDALRSISEFDAADQFEWKHREYEFFEDGSTRNRLVEFDDERISKQTYDESGVRSMRLDIDDGISGQFKFRLVEFQFGEIESVQDYLSLDDIPPDMLSQFDF